MALLLQLQFYTLAYPAMGVPIVKLASTTIYGQASQQGHEGSIPHQGSLIKYSLAWATRSTQPETGTRLKKHPGKVKTAIVILTSLPMSANWSIK